MRFCSLSEIIVACITPFLDSGEVDYPSLKDMLFFIDRNAEGILLLGSTGEGMSLSFSEKKQIVRYACQQNLSVPIFVGVSGIDIDANERFIRECNSLPIQGYLLTTPIYCKPGVHGQIAWFRRLMHSTSLPVVLYNIPSRCGVSLHTEVVSTLAIEENFLGIKEASGNPSACTAFLSCHPHCRMFCGEDLMIDEYQTFGAQGWINVVGNVWPEVASRYYYFLQKFCSEGIDARPWKEACSLLFSGGNPVSVKAVLKYLGMIRSAYVRSPLSKLDFSCYGRIDSVHHNLMLWSEKLVPACSV